MKNDMNHPWLQPVWRRALLVGICAAVALWDLWNGNYVWALIFGGLGGYGYYIFFITWNPETPKDSQPPAGDDTQE